MKMNATQEPMIQPDLAARYGEAAVYLDYDPETGRSELRIGDTRIVHEAETRSLTLSLFVTTDGQISADYIKGRPVKVWEESGAIDIGLFLRDAPGAPDTVAARIAEQIKAVPHS